MGRFLAGCARQYPVHAHSEATRAHRDDYGLFVVARDIVVCRSRPGGRDLVGRTILGLLLRSCCSVSRNGVRRIGPPAENLANNDRGILGHGSKGETRAQVRHTRKPGHVGAVDALVIGNISNSDLY